MSQAGLDVEAHLGVGVGRREEAKGGGGKPFALGARKKERARKRTRRDSLSRRPVSLCVVLGAAEGLPNDLPR